MTIIVLYRNDLRVHDHEPLFKASLTGEPIIPLYVFDDYHERPLGGASKWWLHHALISLQNELEKLGLNLIIKSGKTISILDEMIHNTHAHTVHWGRRYDLLEREKDEILKTHLKSHDIHAESFNTHLLFEPWTIKNKEGKPCRVFTPMWKSCRPFLDNLTTFTTPHTINAYSKKIQSDTIESLNLLPHHPDWAIGFNEWDPSENGALKRAQHFFKHGIANYKEDRNRPDLDATTMLSPFLRFGQISVKKLAKMALDHGHENPNDLKSTENFLSELGWREFSYHLLFHNPHMDKTPLQQKFAHFPWEKNAKALDAWKKGMTGVPIVDAGMRQLWQTGWMHNRVRMIVGSFLVKDLFIPWTIGEEWFWDTLVDADPANNAASWQWVAGCGADAAPYFRVFNPYLQSKKFDPNGDYIRQYVPELSNLDNDEIHDPKNPPMGYPKPIVDHSTQRDKALEIFKSLGQRDMDD